MKDIQVITGCMFAGKTTELINRLKRHPGNYILIKPDLDTRDKNNEVSTHDGKKEKAIKVSTVSQIFDHLKNINTIGIDEAQFFSSAIVDDINYLASKGFRLIIAGLDKDYLNQPFGYMKQLENIATSITRLQAKCNNCGNVATYSHRISDDTPQLLIGDKDLYKALCEICFQKNNKIT